MHQYPLLLVGMGCLLGAAASTLILDSPETPASAAEQGRAIGQAIAQVTMSIVGVILLAVHGWRVVRRRKKAT